MQAVSILITALALAMDAMAVSVAAGLSKSRPSFSDALRLALCFGSMQALMPFVGIVVGGALRPYVEEHAGLVAGLVLFGLGAYGVGRALSNDEEPALVDFFSTPVLLSLGFATSIDAFAAGISFAFSTVSVVGAIATIGLVTFFLCFTAVRLAAVFASYLGKRAELVSGAALICLGLAQALPSLLAHAGD